MLEYLATRDVGPADEMELDLAPRINLLTGDNGLGKTFVLDLAWWALTGTWAGLEARPKTDTSKTPEILYAYEGIRKAHKQFDFRSQKWTGKDGRPITHFAYSGIVLYSRVGGGFSVWDWARDGEAEEKAAHSAYHFDDSSLWNGLHHGDDVLCNGLLRDWVTWQLGQDPAFEILKAVLQELSPAAHERLIPGPPRRISTRDARDIPTLEMPYENVPVVYVSAGMRRILSLAYLAVWAWKEHRAATEIRGVEPTRQLLFLIDEVEAHLHPQWQRVILPAILEVKKHLEPSLDVQILATTHSPMVLTSIEPEFDRERDALFVFDLEGGDVELRKADWRPRGDASGWLTSEVFGLDEARSLPAEEAIEAARAAMRRADLPLEEVRRIHHDLHAVLKDTDPFWPRWLATAEAAGIEP